MPSREFGGTRGWVRRGLRAAGGGEGRAGEEEEEEEEGEGREDTSPTRR